MNARKIAEKNKILEFSVGSQLYGTATPTSDTDYSGVFMPDENMIFGFEKAEEVDLSVVSKKEDGRNDEDAIDSKLYEIRKFIKLALDNNPNVIEQMFINTDNIKFMNAYGNELLLHKHLFPHLGLKQKFLGYAFSQKHKMVIRTENYSDLEDAQEWIDRYIKVEHQTESLNIIAKRLIIEIYNNYRPPFMKTSGDNIQIGDLKFQKHFMLRKVKKIIDERLAKATNRTGLMDKYGYDTKFGSHLVRLMLEGKELLETGELQFPLSYADTILDIKLGKWKMEDVLSYAEQLEADIETWAVKSDLPKKPRYDEVQNLTKKLLRSWVGLK